VFAGIRGCLGCLVCILCRKRLKFSCKVDECKPLCRGAQKRARKEAEGGGDGGGVAGVFRSLPPAMWAGAYTRSLLSST